MVGCFSRIFGISAGGAQEVRAGRDKSPAALCLASSFNLPTFLGAELDVQDKAFDL
jgi:hypothetical protein